MFIRKTNSHIMDQEQRKYDDNLQEGKSENYQELHAKKNRQTSINRSDNTKERARETLDRNQPREKTVFRSKYSTTDHIHILNCSRV